MMVEPEILTTTSNIRLLHLQPPIPGYNKFIGPYLISGEKNAVVDTGPAAAIPSLLSSLTKIGMNPEDIDYIVFTHIHIDHAGGAGGVARALPNARVLAHIRAHEHLINPIALWEASLKVLGDYAIKSGPIEPVSEDRLMDATDQMKLDLGHELTLEIYLTPGHAVHHLSLFDRVNGVLLAGEAAGVCINGSIRMATPPPFKLEVTLSSIDKLIALEPRKLCYSHFGCYDNGLERLKLYRRKLVEWYEIISSAASGGKNPEEILKVLREKDKDLDYLDKLDSDVYSRELSLLVNSIRGIAGPHLT
ncbi:MAG: MBL fold metallo-hydrolase [Dehalococcoidia bacterium]|nr:MBL fold metallo-hydrolase [Dehalococcoidia bacterium]